MRTTPLGFTLSLAFYVLLLLPSCQQTGEVVDVDRQVAGGDTTDQLLSLDIAEVELPKRSYLIFRQELGLQDVPGFLAIEADSLRRKASRASVEAAGPMTGLFYEWDVDQGYADAAVALPVEGGTELMPYVTISFEAQPALAVEFAGSYDRLSAYHLALGEALRARGLTPAGPSIEEYIVGPDDTKDRDAFRTRIIYPFTPAE